MKFLEKIITEILQKNKDLSDINIVLPGKRPIVFIKKILMEKQYSGFLPQIYTIEDLVTAIADKQSISGLPLWFFSFKVYQKLHPNETMDNFLKWCPTLLKDWDDMLKFSEDDKAVLEFMLDEERIRNWAENLSDNAELPRNKFLDFWKKMNEFLPILKKELLKNNLATPGLMHAVAISKINEFTKNTNEKWIFAGFNALTPVEKKLIKRINDYIWILII
jgi:ATP-dependent helicase/nuclease subunit B